MPEFIYATDVPRPSYSLNPPGVKISAVDDPRVSLIVADEACKWRGPDADLVCVDMEIVFQVTEGLDPEHMEETDTAIFYVHGTKMVGKRETHWSLGEQLSGTVSESDIRGAVARCFSEFRENMALVGTGEVEIDESKTRMIQ